MIAKTFRKYTQKTIHDTILSASKPSHNTGASNFNEFERPIAFPFKWEFAEIFELSPIEKEQINRIRTNFRKKYYRSCDLCGNGGEIGFRKVSNGYSSLLCRPCADDYVRKALRLKERLEKN